MWISGSRIRPNTKTSSLERELALLEEADSAFLSLTMIVSLFRSVYIMGNFCFNSFGPFLFGKFLVVIADIVRNPGSSDAYCFPRAGPRDHLRYHPSEVKAAIVTCGGLCPGINDVIQEIVEMLHCISISFVCY